MYGKASLRDSSKIIYTKSYCFLKINIDQKGTHFLKYIKVKMRLMLRKLKEEIRLKHPPSLRDTPF